MSNEVEMEFDGMEETSVLDDTKVTAFTVSVTVSRKVLGDLVSITLGETREADEKMMTAAAFAARKLAAQELYEQANNLCDAEVAKRGAVQVKQVSNANAAFTSTTGTYTVTPGSQAASAPQSGAQAAAVTAVANGAPVGNDGWMSVANKFGDGDMRFLTTAVFPTQRLEGEVAAWLASKGLDARFFKVWDNRPGMKGLEAGVPQGCVANIKLHQDAPGAQQLGKAAAARVKFNNNGTLYIWLTKEFEAALKFVGTALSNGSISPASQDNPFQ